MNVLQVCDSAVVQGQSSIPDSQSLGVNVQLEGVSKSFASRTALRHVDFEAEPGEFVAVIGHSGCGKSTLLRLIAGLEVPTVGSVFVDEHSVAGPLPTARMMFQEPRLLPWLNVVDNLSIGRNSKSRDRALRVLDQVGLVDRQNDLPGILSGGQKQRVALARALASSPKLLLLDEPLGALDALTRIEMQQLIEQVWQDETFTAILVTHDVEEAVILADTVVVMRDGAVEDIFLVDLPRPRRRNHPGVGQLAQLLLDRLLAHADASSTRRAHNDS